MPIWQVHIRAFFFWFSGTSSGYFRRKLQPRSANHQCARSKAPRYRGRPACQDRDREVSSQPTGASAFSKPIVLWHSAIVIWGGDPQSAIPSRPFRAGNLPTGGNRHRCHHRQTSAGRLRQESSVGASARTARPPKTSCNIRWQPSSLPSSSVRPPQVVKPTQHCHRSPVVHRWQPLSFSVRIPLALSPEQQCRSIGSPARPTKLLRTTTNQANNDTNQANNVTTKPTTTTPPAVCASVRVTPAGHAVLQ